MFPDLINAAEIDAALICSEHTVLYLTGYRNPDCCIFITPEKKYYLTDTRYTNEAKNFIPNDYEIINAGKQFENTIKNLVLAHKIRKIGIEANALSYPAYKNYEKQLKELTLVDISEQIAKKRITKSPEQIDYISRAADIADKAFCKTLSEIKEGISEIELAYILQLNMVKEGAEGIAFDTICVFGDNTSNPHGHPTHRKLKSGDAVLLDFGAVYKGYCSDMTRSLFFGKPSDEYVKIYNIVKDANTLAINSMYAGITGAQADSISRDYIDRAGYAKYFSHSLGHGVGVEVHEKPYLAINSTDILDNNMVFTIEPGIYVKEFGVRIEDLITLQNNKTMALSHSDKNLIII